MEIKKVGIKYCGGCNPTYERVEIIQGVRFQLRDQFLFTRHDEKDIDALIIINGCPRGCAAQDLNQEVFFYSVTGESECDTLINWLKTLNERESFNRFSLSIKGNHF
jgi:hypothetical protein